MRVALLIRSLNLGGAERQLSELARGLLARGFDVSVFCFYGQGKLREELNLAGVRVVDLEKRGRWDVVGFWRRLLAQMRSFQPDVLVGYLAISNILAVMLKVGLPGLKVIYSMRSSLRDVSRYDWVWRFSLWLEGRCAQYADQIIVNSEAGRVYLRQRGFPMERVQVVPNGIAVDRFMPDRILGEGLRAEWGIPPEGRLVGLVGRLDVVKGHAIFLQAARQLVQRFPNAYFVCVGAGPDAYRQEMLALSRQLGLDGRVMWPGVYSEMLGVYNALDICCSASITEGFPNVIGEAMACGLPCVVTDVGDSAVIVGETGRVVAPQDPTALAAALSDLLSMSPDQRLALGRQARQRILDCFAGEQMIDRTIEILLRTAAHH